MVDTLARCMAGADENFEPGHWDCVWMRWIVSAKRSAQPRLSSTTVATRTPAANGGSSALRAGRGHLDRRQEDGHFTGTLHAAKVKDDAPFRDIEFGLEPVSGSLVVTRVETTARYRAFQDRNGTPEQIAGWLRLNDGSATQREICTQFNISRPALAARRLELEAAGVIWAPGPPGKPGRYWLAEPPLPGIEEER